MKKLIIGFLMLALALPAFSGSYSAPAISPIGKIPSPGYVFPPGYIGEYQSSEVTYASAQSLTSGVVLRIASLTLSPGIWQVTGSAAILPATTTSITRVAFSLSTQDGVISYTNLLELQFPPVVPGVIVGVGGPLRTMFVPSSSTQTYFLNCQATFTVSTASCYGKITATRVN